MWTVWHLHNALSCISQSTRIHSTLCSRLYTIPSAQICLSSISKTYVIYTIFDKGEKKIPPLAHLLCHILILLQHRNRSIFVVRKHIPCSIIEAKQGPRSAWISGIMRGCPDQSAGVPCSIYTVMEEIEQRLPRTEVACIHMETNRKGEVSYECV